MSRLADTFPRSLPVLVGLLLAACTPADSYIDAGDFDSGFVDARSHDAGSHDAGTQDAGRDAGPSDGGSGTSDSGYTNMDGGIAPTLTNIQRTIFDQPSPVGCFAAATCHSTAVLSMPAGSLNLSTSALTYANLVGPNGTGVPAIFQGANMPRVDPGNPDNSFIMVKLVDTWPPVNATQYGNQMPYTGMQLSPAQIDLIRQWIADGAQNN